MLIHSRPSHAFEDVMHRHLCVSTSGYVQSTNPTGNGVTPSGLLINGLHRQQDNISETHGDDLKTFVGSTLDEVRNLMEISVRFRILPRFTGLGVLSRPVPFRGKYTAKRPLIFINNSTEKLGVL